MPSRKIIKGGTIVSPAGTLQDEIETLPPFSSYGIDPTPTILEPLLKNRDDLAALPFLFPDPNPRENRPQVPGAAWVSRVLRATMKTNRD